MTKPKNTPEAVMRAAAKKAGMLLRASVTEQLRECGTQTAVQVHAVIGGDFDDVVQSLYRMCKAGAARSARGKAGELSKYTLVDEETLVHNASKPHRPVFRAWKLNLKRDPLTAALFGPAKQQHGEMTK